MLYNDANNKLHYDLSFIDVGGKWKPAEDSTRFNYYEFARQEFELTPENMMKQIWPKGILDLKDYSDFCNFIAILGYPRLMTLKTADMVIGEAPVITANAKDKVSEIIKDLRNRSQLDSNFKQGVIDYSRFGVLLVKVFKDDNGKAALTAWDPNEWVPVFYQDGTRRIHYNVIGWYEDDSHLRLQIHDTSDGSYEERYCKTNDGTIKRIISSKKYNKKTGKKLLFAIPNTPTTTNPMGTNDYVIINGLLQKAIERLYAILRVLDEHADPSMTGPSSLLEKSDSGEMVFRTSKYYAVQPEEKEPKYLVWDANLDSSFKAFDLLCEQIYALSEMGSAFLGATKGTGNVVSGTAMRFKMISPLEKARRITNDLTQPLREIVASMLAIEGEIIDAKDLNIFWKDSLPKDPKELVDLTKAETGVKSIKPLLHAIMDNFGYDEDTAKHFIEEILKEQKQFNEVGATKGSNNTNNIDDNNKPGPDSIKNIMNPGSSQNKGSNGGAENKEKK